MNDDWQKAHGSFMAPSEVIRRESMGQAIVSLAFLRRVAALLDLFAEKHDRVCGVDCNRSELAVLRADLARYLEGK